MEKSALRLKVARIRWLAWSKLTDLGDWFGGIRVKPFAWAEAALWWVAETFFDVGADTLEELDDEDRARGIHIETPAGFTSRRAPRSTGEGGEL